MNSYRIYSSPLTSTREKHGKCWFLEEVRGYAKKELSRCSWCNCKDQGRKAAGMLAVVSGQKGPLCSRCAVLHPRTHPDRTACLRCDHKFIFLCPVLCLTPSWSSSPRAHSSLWDRESVKVFANWTTEDLPPKSQCFVFFFLCTGHASVYQCPGAAFTEHHGLDDSNNRNSFPCRPEGWKSKIQVSAGGVSPEALLRGLQMWPPCRGLMWSLLCICLHPDLFL